MKHFMRLITAIGILFVVLSFTAKHANASDRSADVHRSGAIYVVDPEAASVTIPSISVRGREWGTYEERGAMRAWLIDLDSQEMFELIVARNYRDCSFVSGSKSEGGCILEPDEIFLRLEIPENLKLFLPPKKYGLYVLAQNNIDAMARFTVLSQPLFQNKGEPSIALFPDGGPIGTYTVLFGAVFARGEGLSVRFDGVKISVGGYLAPDSQGTFDNAGFNIPGLLKKDESKILVQPGEHTIEVSNDNPQNMVRASAVFTVTQGRRDQKTIDEQRKKEQEERERLKKEDERLKKEKEQAEKEQARIEKERKELQRKLKEKQEEERKQQDEERKQIEKERKGIAKKLKRKREEEKKKEQLIDTIEKQRDDIEKRFCDPLLPITFQPECISKKPIFTKSEYEGQPCRADLSITFQPGCVAQIPAEQKKLFEGKICNSDIPRVWQEGCVDVNLKTGVGIEGKPYCNPLVPTYSQTECEKQPENSPEKPFAAKQCDPNLPRVWQEGCVL